jgi:prophage regulatory protein
LTVSTSASETQITMQAAMNVAETAATPELNSNELLKRAAVLALVQIDNVTLWRWTKRGAFPAPVRIGSRAVRWRRSDVDRWLAELK